MTYHLDHDLGIQSFSLTVADAEVRNSGVKYSVLIILPTLSGGGSPRFLFASLGIPLPLVSVSLHEDGTDKDLPLKTKIIPWTKPVKLKSS